MKKLSVIILSAILPLLCITTLQAQEVLTGLTVNKQVAREAAKARPAPSRNALHLPFTDDFSNYTGYPNPALWQDCYAYVNRTFAIQPPTMGVATLDALDDNGRVYANATNDPFRADNLTSLPIRLDYNFALNRDMRVGDSLYLSFYYQPAGGTQTGTEWERLGNTPEGYDSLVLEFGYATGNIVFIGYEYCDYFLGEDEMYVAGDTLLNPFIPGQDYVFEAPAFPGQCIPLPCDSLFGEEMVWEHIWSAPGQRLDDWNAENPLCYFKQVMIPINDARWLINNFQFRFRNYASLEDNHITGWASNVDQWNIDYVRLDVNRTWSDTTQNDVAFVMPTTTILRDYQYMPWSQYRDSELGDHFENVLVNLSNTPKNSDYTYNVRKQGGGLVASYTTNNLNAYPYWTHGLHAEPQHASPAFEFSSLPADNADSATFVITHVFQEVGSGSMNRSNDTCIFYQNFHNYFAYDDGTAEAGYSLLSNMTYPQSYFAMQFHLNQPDTLRAVRMWFNSVAEDANIANFTLMVWDDDNGTPGDEIYSMPGQVPCHAQQFEDFVTYYLDNPIPVEGTFHVGFFQNHNVQLNLGFDQNTDARGKWKYKTTSEWNESFLKGTPMIRAVVGKEIDHSNVAENQLVQCNIYPNPATDLIHIQQPENGKATLCRIFDVTGALVYQQTMSTSLTTVSLSALKSGIYFVQLSDNQKIIASGKFVKP
jgi:hypothetical protein